MKRVKNRITIAIMGLAIGILGIGWGIIGHEEAKHAKINILNETSSANQEAAQETDILDLMGRHYT